MTAPNPNGCRHCGDDEIHHGWQWDPSAGLHQWQPPTQAQILDRMKARRASKETT